MNNHLAPLLLAAILVIETPSGAQSTTCDYLQKLSTKIKKHYFPHQHLKREKDKIQFSLDVNGKASNVKVLQLDLKSKITKSERAVLEYAVTSSSPFEKPPSEIKCPATIEVTLDNRYAKVAASIISK